MFVIYLGLHFGFLEVPNLSARNVSVLKLNFNLVNGANFLCNACLSFLDMKNRILINSKSILFELDLIRSVLFALCLLNIHNQSNTN
jgi:hypothetical protein